jgi:hypothetical protein
MPARLALGAEIDGNWTVSIDDYTFKRGSGTLTGTTKSLDGAPVNIDGAKVAFSVDADLGGSSDHVQVHRNDGRRRFGADRRFHGPASQYRAQESQVIA